MTFSIFPSFLLFAFLLLFSLVKCDDDSSSCPLDDNGDLMDKLNASDTYDSLSPFGKVFFDKVPSEKFFHKLFNSSFPMNEVRKDFFDTCILYSARMGLNCAISSCNKQGQQTIKAFKKGLDDLAYFKIIATTLENSLEEEGNLNPDNAEDMAELFLNDVGHYLSSSPKNPRGALFALTNGATNFFRSVGVKGMKDISYVTKEFGNQFQQFAEGSNQVESTTQHQLLDLDADLSGDVGANLRI